MANLTERQVAVLRTLARQEYPTIRDLSDWTRIPRSSAPTAVMSLVRDGLARKAGVANSGGTTFTITDAGHAALEG